ncbi:MAG: Trm112 family protein [Nitrososphaeria archaeon]|nr:Trm112 family protein [Aigarchaeota archaeon]MCX8187012.1 Trm112 family protein [Nitrososphaeria archaeon]MDW8021332.1 Trm112 family protein [Nitrososphaerota archaeon]
MKYRLMDLLICPMCRHFPLVLHVFETREIEQTSKSKKCEIYCGYEASRIDELINEPDCEECWKKEIVTGLLSCGECGRWYPIQDEIPRMLPDNMRDKNRDSQFLTTWKARIPDKILAEGRPFNLSGRLD